MHLKMRPIAADWAAFSLRLYVCWAHNWALQNGWTDRDAFWGDRLMWTEGTMYPVLDGGARRRHVRNSDNIYV